MNARARRSLWHSAAAHYGWGLLALHWLTLVLIGATFVIGLILADMPLSPLKLQLYAWHKWLGMLVLALLPLRLLLRYLDRLGPERELWPWEVYLSRLVHALLYLMMFAVPMLGWLHSSAAGFPVVWFAVLPLPDLVDRNPEWAKLFETLHFYAVYALAALVALHALAALYHHYIRRDAVLQRMWPWLR